MATKYIQGNVNWSNGQWYTAASGGDTTTPPTTGDIAELNGYTLTADGATIDMGGATIRNTAGGVLALGASSTTITAVLDQVGNSQVLPTVGSGKTVYWVGNMANSYAARRTVSCEGGKIYVTGNVSNTGTGAAIAVVNNADGGSAQGIVVVSGSATITSTDANAAAIYHANYACYTEVGSADAGANGRAIYAATCGHVNVLGAVTGRVTINSASVQIKGAFSGPATVQRGLLMTLGTFSTSSWTSNYGGVWFHKPEPTTTVPASPGTHYVINALTDQFPKSRQVTGM